MTLRYKNITISGGVAVGTSTLVSNLKPYLVPKGWQFFSGGEFMHEYAIKKHLFPKRLKIHHQATVYSDEFDRKVDHEIRNRLKREKKLVVESWLAGYFARDLKTTLKILLICTNDDLRVDRLANRDNLTVSQARRQLKLREQNNFKKWHRLYGKSDFFDKKYYNLVIDTFSSGPLETVGKALDIISYTK